MCFIITHRVNAIAKAADSIIMASTTAVVEEHCIGANPMPVIDCVGAVFGCACTAAWTVMLTELAARLTK